MNPAERPRFLQADFGLASVLRARHRAYLPVCRHPLTEVSFAKITA
jgi:hypothetical protein